MELTLSTRSDQPFSSFIHFCLKEKRTFSCVLLCGEHVRVFSLCVSVLITENTVRKSLLERNLKKMYMHTWIYTYKYVDSIYLLSCSLFKTGLEGLTFSRFHFHDSISSSSQLMSPPTAYTTNYFATLELTCCVESWLCVELRENTFIFFTKFHCLTFWNR